MRQLPLGVQLGVSLRFDTFAPGANAEAIEALQRLAGGALRAPVWIYGPAGSGKSHLLQAACAAAGGTRQATAYLPLGQLSGAGAGLLDGCGRLELVALDALDRLALLAPAALDAVARAAAWESALFTPFNGLPEHGGRLAIAAAGAPAATAIRLPDLASRLAASEVHRLEPLAESAQPAA